MALHRSDLDPVFAERVRGALAASRGPLPDSPPQTLGRMALSGLMIAGGYLVGLVVIGTLIGPDHKHPYIPNIAVALLFGAFLFGVPWLVSRWWTSGRRAAQPFDREISRGELPATLLEPTLAQMALDGADAGYGRGVLLLAEMIDTGRMDEPRARALLKEMNVLLAADRDLTIQQRRIDDASGGTTVAQCRAEQQEITRRLVAESDPAVCESLSRALLACDARLENIQALHDQAARVAARRNEVTATLSSLESTLTRLRISPHGGATDALDLTDLQERIAAFNREARSTEQAVQEIAAL